jgi:hypothetical protein
MSTITPRRITTVLFSSLTVLLVCIGLSGCAATNGGRIQARINEKSDAFAKLTKQQQKDIKWGYVRPGYTPEMVYFAFGKPDQIIASADKTSYVWVFVDRSSTNEEIAKASALRSAGQGDSIMVRNGAGGSRTTVWPGHDANFPSLVSHDQTFPVSDQSSADIYSTINATENLPTIWVAFRDNAVVNVQRIGGHDPADKTGSLGG